MLKVGIFELGMSDNLNDAQVIEDTILLSQLVDELGYDRIWLGEHHDEGVAWHSPEILMAIICGITNNINVGAAGILLPLNAPLRVAQNFKLLSTLFPNRIDLGIARGHTSPYIAGELLNGSDCKSFIASHAVRSKKLINYLQQWRPIDKPAEPYARPSPNSSSLPNVWIMGSSGATVDFSLDNNINFALSLMHLPNSNYDVSKNVFATFNEKNLAQPSGKQCRSCIALNIVCAENDNETEWISKNANNNFSINAIGNVNECCDKVLSICEDFNCNEVVLHFMCTNAQEKRRVVEKTAKRLML